MAGAGISGAGLALATAGGVVLWAGLSGATPLTILKSTAKGKMPPPVSLGSPMRLFEKVLADTASTLTFGLASNQTPAGVPSGSVPVSLSGSATAAGSAIAAAAVKYTGTPYRWGGADPSGWDCSGFVTYVLHHDLGYQLPSNTHTVTMQFYTWSGAITIPTSQAQAGDLVCWPTHVAIAIGPTTCVGAETYGVGTVTGEFTSMGPGGETFVIRRVKSQATVSAPVVTAV
jgi:cell wall-associated NlpC family hydrolase